MSLAALDSLTPWGMLLALGAHFAAGIMVGTLYFRSLWRTTRRIASGRRTTATIVLIAGRFILLGSLLVLASLEGALPLLTMALGVLVARFAVIRTVREAAP